VKLISELQSEQTSGQSRQKSYNGKEDEHQFIFSSQAIPSIGSVTSQHQQEETYPGSAT
jgi:hypothetical protein